MDAQMNNRRIVIFLAIAFGFSWTVIAVFQLTDWMDDLIAQPLMALAAMNYIQLCGPAGLGGPLAAAQFPPRLAVLPGGLAAAAPGDGRRLPGLLPALPSVL
jgi:hypothetical protein